MSLETMTHSAVHVGPMMPGIVTSASYAAWSLNCPIRPRFAAAEQERSCARKKKQ